MKIVKRVFFSLRLNSRACLCTFPPLSSKVQPKRGLTFDKKIKQSPILYFPGLLNREANGLAQGELRPIGPPQGHHLAFRRSIYHLIKYPHNLQVLGSSSKSGPYFVPVYPCSLWLYLSPSSCLCLCPCLGPGRIAKNVTKHAPNAGKREMHKFFFSIKLFPPPLLIRRLSDLSYNLLVHLFQLMSFLSPHSTINSHNHINILVSFQTSLPIFLNPFLYHIFTLIKLLVEA